jgi:biotin-dependent carboxylase-like uncharacterized protein
VIEIVRAFGASTIQDLGRPGVMHMGVPRGGALAPALLARANLAVGNDPNAAAIEVAGTMTLRARTRLAVALDDGAVQTLASDQTLDVDGAARVRYVAVGGGIHVPRVLGGRGTLLVATLGGFDGRALARGDVLRVMSPHAAPRDELARADSRMGDASDAVTNAGAPVRVVPGPDRARFVLGLGALTSGTWRISPRRNRVGARLEGGHIERTDAGANESTPMVRGAVQVPPSGEPIVLGPDHPTTGGYPVVAIVVEEDLGALYTRPAGAAVTFTLAPRVP